MSENEKFEVSSEWSAEAQINTINIMNGMKILSITMKSFGVSTAKELIGLNRIQK